MPITVTRVCSVSRRVIELRALVISFHNTTMECKVPILEVIFLGLKGLATTLCMLLLGFTAGTTLLFRLLHRLRFRWTRHCTRKDRRLCFQFLLVPPQLRLHLLRQFLKGTPRLRPISIVSRSLQRRYNCFLACFWCTDLN